MALSFQRDSPCLNPFLRDCCLIVLDRIVVWHMLWHQNIYGNFNKEQFFGPHHSGWRSWWCHSLEVTYTSSESIILEQKFEIFVCKNWGEERIFRWGMLSTSHLKMQIVSLRSWLFGPQLNIGHLKTDPDFTSMVSQGHQFPSFCLTIIKCTKNRLHVITI